jgi:hypothetical protein
MDNEKMSMERRSFILVSAFGFLGMGLVPLIRWTHRFSGRDKALAQPKLLSLLCDNRTIRMLGRAYLSLKPDESCCGELSNDFLGDTSSATVLQDMDMSVVESKIEKRIKQDFETSNTVVLKGWVLSITEARQCAFFSILNS